jgi:hypothetical protein
MIRMSVTLTDANPGPEPEAMSTIERLTEIRDALAEELVNAPALKLGTRWYADRAEELARVGDQIRRLAGE